MNQSSPSALAESKGLALMRIEMNRQCADALATLERAGDVAIRIAQAMRASHRVVLYGMGGSHYVNRMVEPLYRTSGLEARAMVASEALTAPLPRAERVAVFVSQSGESGEIVELLRAPAEGDRRFALTLNADSTLGRAAEGALVAAGGPENAFAATRSIILTIAMHAAVLKELGHDDQALRAVLAADAPADVGALDAAVAPCDTFVFAGRHVLAGAAQSAALSLMELSRVTALGFETGQFRHGPFEFLRPGLAVILLRSDGPDRDAIAPIAEATLGAGCVTAVIDAAEAPLPAAALRVPVARGGGLAAATAMLLTLQRLNISVARRRVRGDVGTPLRTSKVTI